MLLIRTHFLREEELGWFPSTSLFASNLWDQDNSAFKKIGRKRATMRLGGRLQ